MAHSIMHSQKRTAWFTTEGRLLSGVVSFLILKIMREAHNFSKPLFPRIILSHSLKKKNDDIEFFFSMIFVILRTRHNHYSIGFTPHGVTAIRL